MCSSLKVKWGADSQSHLNLIIEFNMADDMFVYCHLTQSQISSPYEGRDFIPASPKNTCNDISQGRHYSFVKRRVELQIPIIVDATS
ncbi:hypothetical protein G5I_12230 [Acromyrmex echinatior]|uniref:Uncharacterized protein n=1 Tax=Acromyrmex echinatior TaxID=103372 RepID=F4X1R6_ACREC|nr:hypothetical protein G5I_12230 [Acromyrmex echinatior]